MGVPTKGLDQLPSSGVGGINRSDEYPYIGAPLASSRGQSFFPVSTISHQYNMIERRCAIFMASAKLTIRDCPKNGPKVIQVLYWVILHYPARNMVLFDVS